jgi:hypothetical protein
MNEPLPREARRGPGGRAAAGVFLAALLARAAYGMYAHADGSVASLHYDDEQWYWALAESLRGGQGLVGEFGHRAERMPLYPAILSVFASFSQGPGAARMMQWVIGALAAPLTTALAWQCFKPFKDVTHVGLLAVVAGLGVAFDPALCGMASLLLTETFFVTTLIALWWVALPLVRGGATREWPRWAALGTLAALTIYFREAGVIFVAALLLFLLVARRDKHAAVGAMFAAAMVVAALLPWHARNTRVLGASYWLTSRGGISLYDGVRPGATGEGNLAGVKDSPEVAGLGEVAWDGHFRDASWQVIRTQPGRVAVLVPTKLARTWSPWVHAYESRLIRLVFAVWYVPIYALGAIGAWAGRREPRVLIILLLPVVCITALHSVFVGSVRYRVGAVPTLAILATLGLSYLVIRLSGGRGGRVAGA